MSYLFVRVAIWEAHVPSIRLHATFLLTLVVLLCVFTDIAGLYPLPPIIWGRWPPTQVCFCWLSPAKGSFSSHHVLLRCASRWLLLWVDTIWRNWIDWNFEIAAAMQCLQGHVYNLVASPLSLHVRLGAEENVCWNLGMEYCAILDSFCICFAIFCICTKHFKLVKSLDSRRVRSPSTEAVRM